MALTTCCSETWNSRNVGPLLSVVISLFDVSRSRQSLDALRSHREDRLEIIVVTTKHPSQDFTPITEWIENRTSDVAACLLECDGIDEKHSEAGVAVARGQYVVSLDSDDLVDVEVLIDAASLAAERAIDVVFFQTAVLNPATMNAQHSSDALIWDAVTNGRAFTRTSLEREPRLYQFKAHARTYVAKRDLLLESHVASPASVPFAERFPTYVRLVARAHSIGLLNHTGHLRRAKPPGNLCDRDSRPHFQALECIALAIVEATSHGVQTDALANIATMISTVLVEYAGAIPNIKKDEFWEAVLKIISKIPAQGLDRAIDVFANNEDEWRILAALKEGNTSALIRIAAKAPLHHSFLRGWHKRQNRPKDEARPLQLILSGYARQAACKVPFELSHLREQDKSLIESGFYGAVNWPTTSHPDTAVVYLGGRSGLEALAAQMRSPSTLVVVVESDDNKRLLIDKALVAQGNGRCVGTTTEALALIGDRHIAFMRIDGESFPSPDGILGARRIGRLCGTFVSSRQDPLKLYRSSRDGFAETFFWKELDGDLSFGSDAGTPVYEVSVVVPAYKVPLEIDKCISSLVSQTLASLEVIVVNDGSPDETPTRIREWVSKCPGRVRLVDKPNGGCASARARGVIEATSEYIGFVDGDDWVDAAMFEELYRAAVLTGSEVSQCGYAEAFPEGAANNQREWVGAGGPSQQTGVVTNPLQLMPTRPTIWRRIHRADFLRQNEIVFPILPRFDDMPFQFHMLLHAARVAVMPDPYYKYRQSRPGQDIMIHDERLFIIFQIFDYMSKEVLLSSDYEAERQLARIEVYTHCWILALIDKSLKRRYRIESARHFGRKRTNLTRFDIFALRKTMTEWEERSFIYTTALMSIFLSPATKDPLTKGLNVERFS